MFLTDTFVQSSVEFGRKAARVIIEEYMNKRGLINRGLNEDDATALLEELIPNVTQASPHKSLSWSAYRWTWYLRRAPHSVFARQGDVATSEPYRRMLAQVIATRGRNRIGDAYAGGKPEKISFSMDPDLLGRVMEHVGFASVVSALHSVYRWAAKGARIHIDAHGQVDARPDETTERAVMEYDRLRAQGWGGSPLGRQRLHRLATPDPKRSIILVTRPRVFGADYELDVYDLDELAELLTTDSLLDWSSWSEELPTLLALAYLNLFLIAPRDRDDLDPSVTRCGYAVLYLDQLKEAWLRSGQWLNYLFETVFRRSGRYSPPTCDQFLDQLLAMEGESWPLCAGPVAALAGHDAVCIDLWAASERLVRRMEFPEVQGPIANMRSTAFEEDVQQAIDTTSWRPPPEIKKLRGRQLKHAGQHRCEIDALGYRAGVLLAIDCKSVVQTAEYDRGTYSIVRNVADRIDQDVTKWDSRMEFLQHNLVGTNYDLSICESIAGIVVTPGVFFVPHELFCKEALPGLRSYTSFGELLNWLRTDA